MTLASVDTYLSRRHRLATNRTSWLERILEIRAVEETIAKLFTDGLVRGSTHTCQGQEAIAVGVALALDPSDSVVGTYRGHGIALALGLTPTAVLGEVLGRKSGSIMGLGGSMHLSEPSIGLLPTMAIVGAGIPIAAGLAFAAQVEKTNRVAVAIFGDGASNIGAFHEGINLAAIWDLPVIFVCENNLYGEYSPLHTTTPITDIANRAASYNIPGHVVDGQDVEAVKSALDTAIARARGGAGPTLLEMKTYRFSGHSRSDPAQYRPDGELDSWLARDPLKILIDRLLQNGELDTPGLEELEKTTARRVESDLEQVLKDPPPDTADLFRYVYTSDI